MRNGVFARVIRGLQGMSEVELLGTHKAVIDELLRRDVVKTRNNPIGDYTEWLVCRRLGLANEGNSRAAFDATDTQGVRYQIKGRHSNANSVQFSPVRNLEQHGFDYVVAVVFHEDYSVRQAVKIPHRVFPTLARYQRHINGYSLVWTPKTVEQAGVENISCLLV